MTTPAAMNDLIEEIRNRFEGARVTAERSSAVAINSYGAGFDRGYADALGELLEHILGEPPVTRSLRS